MNTKPFLLRPPRVCGAKISLEFHRVSVFEPSDISARITPPPRFCIAEPEKIISYAPALGGLLI
jgi:hypothetical protein